MIEYLRMLDKIPDSKVRVYLSVIFGCPFEGKISDDVIYESILEASDKGELWGIENSDLTPLEIQLLLSHDFS